jgi:hypothetical protein
MSASETDIATVRRRINEPTDAQFVDDDIASVIETRPLRDADGLGPTDAGWDESYDLAAAASDLWAEKAGARTDGYDFDADGGSFKRSQSFDQCMKMSRYWGKRRAPQSLTIVENSTTTEELAGNPDWATSDTIPAWVANGPDELDYEDAST